MSFMNMKLLVPSNFSLNICGNHHSEYLLLQIRMTNYLQYTGRTVLFCIFQKQNHYFSHCIRKPRVCICENKGTDQLYSNCIADQHLCIRYSDSTIPILLKSKISRSLLPSVTVQASLCQTWLKTQIVFLVRRLIYY